MSDQLLMPSQTGKPMPVIWDGKEWRYLASSPSPHERRLKVSPFAAANPLIPRSSWKAAKRSRSAVPILDQDGRGSCVGHGSATAGMLARDIQGYTFDLLSAPFIYAQINGGQDDGSSPADAAKVLEEVGVCLMSEFPEPNYLKPNIPPAAYETAKRFTFSVYQCSNFDEMVSAWLLGYSVFMTIQCGMTFNNLDSEGVPPVARGMGNHCIAGGDELKNSTRWGWLLDDRNSWSESWGIGGHFFFSEQHATAQGAYFEAYAVRQANPDPKDIVVPPPPQ